MKGRVAQLDRASRKSRRRPSWRSIVIRREKQREGRWFESIPRPPIKVRWRERVSNHENEKHYMTRWTIELPWGSLRLHHWLSSDDLRFDHDHAWNFVSIVLWGRYDEIIGETPRRMAREWLSIRWHRAEHRHCVKVGKPCWTLLITGPEIRKWGFWVKGSFVSKRDYFKRFGHH